jgi:hypothetical protein
MSNKIHPINLLIMSLIFFVAILAKLALIKTMILYFSLLPYVFQGQNEIKENIKKLLFIILAVLVLVLMKIIYAHDSKLAIWEYAVRLYFLFSVSAFSFSGIDFDKVFIYLMASKKMKVTWGYSMLLAMNSLQLLKEEQERISFNAKLRGLKWHRRYLTFFPLLVFAIRHSEKGAMALVTRGINSEKLFYNAVYPTKRDRAILISYLLLTLTFFLVA